MVKFDIEVRLSNIQIVAAEGEGQIDNIRQTICDRIDFDPCQIFKELDSGDKGYIDFEDINQLLL